MVVSGYYIIVCPRYFFGRRFVLLFCYWTRGTLVINDIDNVNNCITDFLFSIRPFRTVECCCYFGRVVLENLTPDDFIISSLSFVMWFYITLGHFIQIDSREMTENKGGRRNVPKMHGWNCTWCLSVPPACWAKAYCCSSCWSKGYHHILQMWSLEVTQKWGSLISLTERH